MDDETFDPPNNGTWELDTTHVSRPISWFARAALLSGFPRGFAEGLARYGLLLGRYDIAVIGGFMYAQMRPVRRRRDGDARADAGADRDVGQGVHRASSGGRTSPTGTRWSSPAPIAAHRAVQAVDPAALSDEDLAEHVGRCADHLEANCRPAPQATARRR